MLAESKDRVNKERSMRRRQLKGLVQRLMELIQIELTRDQLWLKLAAAKSQFPAAWRWVTLQVPDPETEMRRPNFTFALCRDKLRQVRRLERRSLLRSNLSAQAPEKLWQFYIQLTQGRLPSKTSRMICVFGRFTIRGSSGWRRTSSSRFWPMPARQPARLLATAGTGPNPALQVGKVRRHPNAQRAFPTTDERELGFSRFTQPEQDHQMLLAQLGWQLPPPSLPRITQKGQMPPE